MVTFVKRISLAAMAGLAVLGLAADAHAQYFRGGAGGGIGPGMGAGPGPIGGGGVGPIASIAAGARGGLGLGLGRGLAGNALLNNPYATGMLNPNPYSNPFGYGGYGFGGYGMGNEFQGYLSGAADVINSQGQFMISNQQARILKEQVKSMQIDNRRKVFDEWLYERNNTPTLQDDFEKFQKEQRRRMRNDPPPTEIFSGQALNVLLRELQQLPKPGPDVGIDEDAVKLINVQVANGLGNLGVLKNEGRLNWPVALRDMSPAEETRELRQQIDSMVQEAYNQARNGPVDGGILGELDRASTKLQRLLSRNVGDIGFSQYSESKKFLRDLDDSIKVLRNPRASDFVSGKNSAKGKNVAELVKHMTEKGLQFAPASAGDEAAYVALHRAMAQYDVNTQALIAEK